MLSGKVDKKDRLDCSCSDPVTITSPQRRAPDNNIAVVARKRERDRFKPRRAVGIVQWLSTSHFCNVRCRVQIITVNKCGTDPHCERLSDRGLATARYAHDYILYHQEISSRV
jgi:hypothetical protein